MFKQGEQGGQKLNEVAKQGNMAIKVSAETLLGLSWRHDTFARTTVDDVNDTVVGLDIGGGNHGFVDLNAIGQVNGDGFSLDGWGHHAVSQVPGHDLARDNVVSEDGRQGILVVRDKKAVDKAGWKGSEGIVGWGKDGERTLSTDSLDKLGSAQGSNQSLEGSVGAGNLRDGLSVAHGESGGKKEEGRGELHFDFVLL